MLVRELTSTGVVTVVVDGALVGIIPYSDNVGYLSTIPRESSSLANTSEK